MTFIVVRNFSFDLLLSDLGVMKQKRDIDDDKARVRARARAKVRKKKGDLTMARLAIPPQVCI